MSWLSKVFGINPAGINWPRAVMFLDIMLVPLVTFWAIGDEQYLLSAIFGALLTGVADPGGAYPSRVLRMAVFALIGAGLTALGFEIGRDTWGWLVLASSLVTLVAGLGLRFGVHSFVTGLLLNVWFLVALALAFSIHQNPHITSYIWAQVCAWAGGAALWIAVTFLGWLIRGRRDRPAPFEEFPGDTTPRKLTPPMILFAVIRALAIAGSVAIAYGLDLSHAQWVPIAAIVAMKPSLEQSTVVGFQRIVGALIGAGVAMLVLLIPASVSGLNLFTVDRGLETVAIIIVTHAIAVRFLNYAIYSAAIAAAVLILLDLLQPTSYSAEGDRVVWTLCGVGIGVIVILLAGLLAKLRAKAPSQTAPQPTPQPA